MRIQFTIKLYQKECLCCHIRVHKRNVLSDSNSNHALTDRARRVIWNLSTQGTAPGPYTSTHHLPPRRRSPEMSAAARLGSARLVSSPCRGSARLVSARLVSSRLVSSRLVSCRLVSCRLVSCRLVSCRLVSARLGSARHQAATRLVSSRHQVHGGRIDR